MNLRFLNILMVAIQIVFVPAREVIVPMEDDSEEPRSRTTTLDTFKGTENVPARGEDSFREEATNVEGSAPMVNGATISGKDDGPTRIPMTCISNYLEYCANKFVGARFLDGCHKCNCTQDKTNFCETGPCEFFAHSFEHAATYCIELISKNERDYQRQIERRKQISKTKGKTDALKRKVKHKQILSKLLVKGSNSIINEPSNKKEYKEMNATKTQTIPFLNEIRKANKTILIRKNSTKVISSIEKEVSRKIGTKGGALKSLNGLTVSSSFNQTFKRNLKKVQTPNILDDLQNLKETEPIQKPVTINNSEKKEVKEIRNVTEQKELKSNLISAQERQQQFNQSRNLGRKDENDNKPERKSSEKKDLINENVKHIGQSIQEKAHLIQSSLKEISDKKILRTIIYHIASNELMLIAIKKKLKGHVKDEETLLFIKKLKSIESKNMIFKAKILELVKMKLKLSKSNYGPFRHKFNPLFFKNIAKRLNTLNEELNEMKGGVKLWAQMSRTLANSHKAYGNGSIQRISIMVVLFSMMTTFI